MSGRSILVSGGTGSFGSAFLQHLVTTTDATQWRRIICYSRDEVKQSELRRTLTDDRLRWFIGDVRDLSRLSLACRNVQVIVHAAALKRVDTMEENPLEAIKTNVLGTANVIEAALTQGVEQVLLLSTDKAVEPRNLYGASKAAAEKVVLAANSYAGPACSVVRWGNVSNSRGSVLPLWRWQAAQGLPLTVTAPDASRFWVTLPDAVAFAEQVLATMRGGELRVPKMPSVRVGDMARCVSETWAVTGLRVGEKRHEVVVGAHEQVDGLPSPYESQNNSEWLAGDALRAAVAAV